MSANDESLGSFGAVWDAFWNVEMSRFPVLDPKVAPDKLSAAIASQISSELQTVELPDDSARAGEIAVVMSKARESLDEVKSLTEYQDQKATRLLTIISFLSALAGALLTLFAKAYPLHSYLFGSHFNWSAFWIVLSYLVFGAFVLLAISGALVVFYATKTRFKWPKQSAAPRSRLFYDGIVAAPPSAWAKSFLVESGNHREFMPAAALQMAYTKDCIMESYLVAAKVADKLRYLNPAQKILYSTVKLLLVWVLVVGIISLTVPTT
jgi:hypothetical protein